MRLAVQVNGEAGELHLENGQGETWRFEYTSGGRMAGGEAAVVEVEPGIYSVLWNGRSYDAKVHWDGSRGVVDVGPEHFVVEAADPREMEARQTDGKHGSRQELKASMPGKIVRVLVEERQEVVAGQGIVVVEAMKMQNEMRVARAGRVASIRVKAGDAVSAGEALAVIE